jgi:hypothetical protein
MGESVVSRVHTQLTEEIGGVRREITAEIGRVRTELRDEIGLVRTELRDEIGLVRTDLTAEIGRVRTELREEITSVRVTLMDRMDRLQDAMTVMQGDINASFTTSERVERVGRSAADETRALADVVTVLHKQFRLLSARVEAIENRM